MVGMRRAGIPTAHIDAVRQAFHILYRDENVLQQALIEIERDLGDEAAAEDLL